MKRRGTVLLVVVVIVMLLSLAAYGYMLSMQTEHIATAVVGERLVARQAALSARDLLAVLLERPRADRDAMGGLRDNVRLFSGQSLALGVSSELAQTDKPARMGLIAYPIRASDEAGRSGIASEAQVEGPVTTAQQPAAEMSGPFQRPIDGGVRRGWFKPTRYGAVNESSKLHLIKLLEFELSEPGSAVEKLMRLPGMDEMTAEALLDWIDDDDEQRASGAESAFYATLSRPLVPRNAPPTDLDELLFVKGITPGRLFGDPVVVPDILSMPGASQPTHEPFAEKLLPWGELLTVYSAERNETHAGQLRVFVNSEDLTQLHQDLAEVLPSEWATFLVLFRQYGPSSVASAENDKANQVTIDYSVPAAFDISSPLDLIGISVTLTDNDDNEAAVASPFQDDLTSMKSQLPQLVDAITLVPERRVVGRINVNEASPEVLSMLPGLDAETVDSIVSARQITPMDVADRSHPIWLLTEGLVDIDAMRELLPHVTCGGDVYRASVWGRVDDASPMFHFETVLDASEGRTRSVYYRELPAPRGEIQIPTAAEFGDGSSIVTNNKSSPM